MFGACNHQRHHQQYSRRNDESNVSPKDEAPAAIVSTSPANGDYPGDLPYDAPPYYSRQSYGYEGWHGCRHHYYEDDNKRMDQARRISEVIGKRSFEGKVLDYRYDSLTPPGFGYGMLIAGATFIAVKAVTFSTVGRPLGRVLGKRVAYSSLVLASGVAAGTLGGRYMQNRKTLEDLKIMGSYLSPKELSPSADAISQHPLIARAIQEQRDRKQQRDFVLSSTTRSPSGERWDDNLPYNWDHYHHHHHYRHTSWFSPLQGQILTELDNVLEHCEERRGLLGISDSSQKSSLTAKPSGRAARRRWGSW